MKQLNGEDGLQVNEVGSSLATPDTNVREIASRDASGHNRALDWMCLLPRGTHLRLEPSIPASIASILQERAHPNGEALVAYRHPESMEQLTRFQSVVVLQPDRELPDMLARLGFQHLLLFVAIPSLARPRILVPLGNRSITLGGLDLVAPFQRDARIKKVALTGLAYLGRASAAGDVLLLARRQKSNLEHTLEAITGRDELHLALAPGAVGEFRKLTLRLMEGNGKAVGFAKLGTTLAARDAIGRESRMLRYLAGYPDLRLHVPELIGMGQADGALVSVQTPGTGRVSSPTFDNRHRELLNTLARVSARRTVFGHSTMWHTIQVTYDMLETELSPRWLERTRAAFTEVDGALGTVELTMPIAHRDFGPWNIRIQPDGRLFVFDWETAQPEMVPLYDYFDFHLRSHVLLGRSSEPLDLAQRWLSDSRDWFPRIPAALTPSLFLAYLLDRALSRSRYAIWRGDDQPDPLLDLLGDLLDTRGSWMRW